MRIVIGHVMICYILYYFTTNCLLAHLLIQFCKCGIVTLSPVGNRGQKPETPPITTVLVLNRRSVCCAYFELLLHPDALFACCCGTFRGKFISLLWDDWEWQDCLDNASHRDCLFRLLHCHTLPSVCHLRLYAALALKLNFSIVLNAFEQSINAAFCCYMC